MRTKSSGPHPASPFAFRNRCKRLVEFRGLRSAIDVNALVLLAAHRRVKRRGEIGDKRLAGCSARGGVILRIIVAIGKSLLNRGVAAVKSRDHFIAKVEGGLFKVDEPLHLVAPEIPLAIGVAHAADVVKFAENFGKTDERAAPRRAVVLRERRTRDKQCCSDSQDSRHKAYAKGRSGPMHDHIAEFSGLFNGSARLIPGDARQRLIPRNKFSRRGVIAGDRLARYPLRPVIDHDNVPVESRVGARQRLEDVYEAANTNIDRCFLPHLAPDGVRQHFSMMEAPARDRPKTLEWRLAAPNDEHRLRPENNGADPNANWRIAGFEIAHGGFILRAVMCGRFLFTSPPEAARHAFAAPVTRNFPPRWNIAPTQPIALVRADEKRAREFALARWGFIPSWAKKDYFEKVGTKPLINARGETVAEKPTFRNAFKRRRCLIPADGFYEWRTEDGARQPYLIRPVEDGLFAFGGIWETAVDPDGGEIDTAAIVTTAAGPDIASLHNREPLVIAPENYERWLDPDELSAPDAMTMIHAAPQGFWRFHPVSKAVNNARNEGETLAREIGQRELF